MKFYKRIMDRIRQRQKPYSFLKIIIAIVILISFILIGTPIKYNCLPLNIAIIAISFIYIIYKGIIKKDKILVTHIDIIITVLCLSPLIPLVFNTYSSLIETLYRLSGNLSILSLYIIIKQEFIKDNENTNFITNALIIAGVILVILGIDELTSKTIYKHINLIGIPEINNNEHRMFATFGYANAFAIVMVINICICLNRLKTHKFIFSVLTVTFSIGLFLSYSRSVISMFILFLVFYILYKGNAKQKINHIFIFIVIAILIGIAYIIGIKMDRPLILFENEKESNSVRRDIINVEKDKEYIFEFDITAKSRLLEKENYSISIVVENVYFDPIDKYEISFSNFEGKKEIKFKTPSNAAKIVVWFKCKEKIGNKGLTINNMKINGKDTPVKYLYIPTKLVEKIQSFNAKSKSVWERIEYYKDALKIISQNLWSGTGGRGWQYNHKKVQSYAYNASEAHSSILEVFIESGIIGGLAFAIICIYSLIRIIKKKKNITLIDVAFLLLTVHSFIDFELSFYCIMITWIALFAIVNKEDKKEIKISKQLITIIFIIISILGIILGIYSCTTKNKNDKIKKEIVNNIEEKKYNDAMKKMQRYCKTEKYEKFYSYYLRIDYNEVNNSNLEYLYNKIKNEKLLINSNDNILRSEVMQRVIEQNQNQEMASKFAKLIIKENEEMVEKIKDKEKNRITDDEEIEQELKLQERAYEFAQEILNERIDK